jgi:hypothetical protein
MAHHANVDGPTMICDSSIPVCIYSLHDLVQELIRIFQGYIVFLAT